MSWTEIAAVCSIAIAGSGGVVGLVALGVVVGNMLNDERARRAWRRRIARGQL